MYFSDMAPALKPADAFARMAHREIVRYLKFARHFNEQSPGFETDLHGLVKEIEGGKARYYVDCVR
jgi:arginine decarboxylase